MMSMIPIHDNNLGTTTWINLHHVVRVVDGNNDSMEFFLADGDAICVTFVEKEALHEARKAIAMYANIKKGGE